MTVERVVTGWQTKCGHHAAGFKSGVVMSKSGVRVNLEDLVPGMVLAEDAMHMNGRVLLSAGSCLTDRHLKIFKTWGLTEAYIRGGGENQPDNKSFEHIDSDVVEHAKKAVLPYFSHLNCNSEFVAELYKICVREPAEMMVKTHG